MNLQERAKRYLDALRFSDRWVRDANDEEATALLLISAALEPLGYAQRRRIMTWAESRFPMEARG